MTSNITSHSVAGCRNHQTPASGRHQQQQQQQAGLTMAHPFSLSADELRKRVELLDEKNAITDMVIRQLSDQIARLTSTSNGTTHGVATVVMETSAAAAAAAAAEVQATKNSPLNSGRPTAVAEVSGRCASDAKKPKETRDAGIQVDLGWTAAPVEHSGLHAADKARFQSFQDLTSVVSRSMDTDDSADDAGSTAAADTLHDRLLTCRLREATMMGHLKDYRRRIEELDFLREMHEAQITRLNEEMSRLKQVLVECRGKENETQSLIADLQLSLADLQHRFDEQTLLSQLRDVEHRQATEDLQRKLLQLENEKHRLIGALQSTGAAGYYAIAHCTAPQTDRHPQQHLLQQQQQQSRLGRHSNTGYDIDDDDDEYDFDRRNHATSAVVPVVIDSAPTTPCSGGALESEMVPRSTMSLGDVRAMHTSPRKHPAVATNAVAASSAKTNSSSVQRVNRVVASDESTSSSSPGRSRRHVVTRDFSNHDDAVLSTQRPPVATVSSLEATGGCAPVVDGANRQRVSFYVTAAAAAAAAAEVPPSSSKFQSNVAGSNRLLPSTTSQHSSTSGIPLVTTSASAAAVAVHDQQHHHHQHPVDSRAAAQVPPNRKSAAARSPTGQLPPPSSTLGRQQQQQQQRAAAAAAQPGARRRSAGGRSFDALTSACDNLDSLHVGNVGIKAAGSASAVHRHTGADRPPVYFNGESTN